MIALVRDVETAAKERGALLQRAQGDFYPAPPHADEPCRLTYRALIEDTGLLAAPMQVLTERALPWRIGIGRLVPHPSRSFKVTPAPVLG